MDDRCRILSDTLTEFCKNHAKEDVFSETHVFYGMMLDLHMGAKDASFIKSLFEGNKEDLEKVFSSQDDSEAERFARKVAASTNYREDYVISIVAAIVSAYCGRTCQISIPVPPIKENISKNGAITGTTVTKDCTEKKVCSCCGLRTECYRALDGWVCQTCLNEIGAASPTAVSTRRYRKW